MNKSENFRTGLQLLCVRSLLVPLDIQFLNVNFKFSPIISKRQARRKNEGLQYNTYRIKSMYIEYKIT
jgi:hypothetical protein